MRRTVYTKTVELNITSTDEPLPGAAESANAHMTDILSAIYNVASGNVEMRISNEIDMGRRVLGAVSSSSRRGRSTVRLARSAGSTLSSVMAWGTNR